MDLIDQKLLDGLKAKEDTLYGISQRSGIAWSTAKLHLLMLEKEGRVEQLPIENPINGKKTVTWRVKDGTN